MSSSINSDFGKFFLTNANVANKFGIDENLPSIEYYITCFTKII